MANNVVKYIDCTGDRMSLKVIELASFLAYRERANGEDDEALSLSNALHHMGCNYETANRHGWAELTNVSVEDTKCGGSQDIVSLTTLTPYGNLEEVMAELRKHFPLCEFHCFNEKEEENEVD